MGWKPSLGDFMFLLENPQCHCQYGYNQRDAGFYPADLERLWA